MALGVGSGRGMLRCVSPDSLSAQEAAQHRAAVVAQDRFTDRSLWQTNLAGFVDGEFSRFQRHRDSANGWSDRLVAALRCFKGEYDPGKLRDIRKFGGSDIY